MDLPQPGELVQHDFRRPSAASGNSKGIKLLQVSVPSMLSLAGVSHIVYDLTVCVGLQWNIERGYKLPEIVEELRGIDADIIALQEVDIGCERSLTIDIGALPV